MIEVTISNLGLGMGLAFTVTYVVRCRVLKKQPDLATASVCILTGAGLIIGPILMLRPFTDAFKEVQPKAEHLCLAGLAIIWVSLQFVARIWSRAEDSPPPKPPHGPSGDESVEPNPLHRANP